MLAFIDETGDHNLVNIDPNYPLFGLGALVISEEEYAKMDKEVSELKQEFFSDDGTFILHSSELKRPVHRFSDPRNVVMGKTETRKAFYDAFDARIVRKFDYRITACFIGKRRMAENYCTPENPYYFSFENLLNRILWQGGGASHALHAEKRGDDLNTELLAEYERFCRTGIRFHDADTVIGRTSLNLVGKDENVNGLQVIDLMLACLARHYLGKTAKMVGNDLNPKLLETKFSHPVTFFPYRKNS